MGRINKRCSRVPELPVVAAVVLPGSQCGGCPKAPPPRPTAREARQGRHKADTDPLLHPGPRHSTETGDDDNAPGCSHVPYHHHYQPHAPPRESHQAWDSFIYLTFF